MQSDETLNYFFNNMVSKKTEERKLKLTDYLDKAFDVLPSNAFIHNCPKKK